MPRPTSNTSKPKVVQSSELENGKSRSRVRKKKNFEGMEFIAPDGGWGWVVAVACGLSNFSTLPLGQNFGLIYKEKFEEWGITQAEYSFMRNLEFSISSTFGLFSGALLRMYGYRKMALIGASLIAISHAITSQISNITYFTIFFAILGGIGGGITWPSNALALNTYFKKKRGIATGLSWTATGLSPVLMPQLITLLMHRMDVHGTVLVLSGITLNAIPMALLLQPAHWHGKWVPVKKPEPVAEDVKVSEEEKAFLKVPRGVESPSLHQSWASLKRGQVEGVDEDGDHIVDTQSTLGLDVTAPISRHPSVWSLRSARVNHCSHENQCECRTIDEEEVPKVVISIADKQVKDVHDETERVSKPLWRRIISSVVEFFDLTILKDPRFVTIFIGMTLGFAAEVNFALLVPFVYSEYGFDKDMVALFMSVLALIDLVTRFTVPFITDNLNLDPKVMYALGLLILSTGRIALAHLEGFNIIMAATVWLGFGKGLRTVFMALVIPSYVPLHRLPTASGLQMLANGIIFICIGPIFGYLRDTSDSYTASLHCINVLTFGTILLWSVEMMVDWLIKRNKKNIPK